MLMSSTPQQHNDEIPSANTPAEVNIHLGYIRRDIQLLQTETKAAIESVAKKIDQLDDHYITETEFRPSAEKVKDHELQLKALTAWRDTFNGKMMGFGAAVALASTLLSFALNYFIK